MADTEWTVLTNSISGVNVRRGATSAVAPPNGGGMFLYGFRSTAAVAGGSGMYCNLVNFDPTAAGGRISMAMRKASGSGALNYCPLLFLLSQGVDIANEAYLLGFAADEEPSHLILRKGTMQSGILTTSSDVLRQSTNTYQTGTWYHFQLDAIVQPVGDVYLIVKENVDIAVNPVTAPAWTDVDGMTPFTDDVLGHNSGTPPYVAGRMGYAFYVGGDSGRAAFMDHAVCGRQF